MRKLTLKGFVESYVEELSYSGTTSISKLIVELEENPRLREPLILHGVLSGMPRVVHKRNPLFFQEYLEVKQLTQSGNSIETNIDILPIKYQKVITAYEYKRDKIDKDNDSKLLMRKRIIEIQSQKCISNYRIYTDLGLNPGNVNCFLKHGTADKLGLDVVREIWMYVKAR